ncbi:LemA family protein [Taibaiella soli]|uniref:LemA family protein n=1 Tax=Taibaiella soli TaxID=1649169 RepID=A0A2W2AG75_9BACT|nr:LemA family protein [Taibaiella soli]PZF74465.1 LemA family protein [Taibaiella soli]
MKGGTIALIVLILIVVIGGCGTCNLQRSMVTLDENVKSKWGEVQNQYQRRSDLVPNLVNTVKGAANFEKSTLEAVTQARASATSLKVDPNDLSPEKIKEFQARQGELSQALGRLLMVTENYPQLKANQNFLSLQDQLEGTENRITVARKGFNDAVQQYNTTIRSFPNNILSGMLGFHVKGMFEADAAAQKAPTVQF